MWSRRDRQIDRDRGQQRQSQRVSRERERDSTSTGKRVHRESVNIASKKCERPYLPQKQSDWDGFETAVAASGVSC